MDWQFICEVQRNIKTQHQILWALELDGDFYVLSKLCKVKKRETKALYLTHINVFLSSCLKLLWKKNKIPIHLYTEQIES